MTVATVDVSTSLDGTLVIRPQGVLEAADTIGLRHALVQAIRHTRPLRLVLDLAGVRDLDPINLGTLAAACHLGDDYQVAVFIDNAPAELATRLIAAGVSRHRLRHVL